MTAVEVERLQDLTPSVLQDLLRLSLDNPSLKVTSVKDPEELLDLNVNLGSDLRKLVVTVEEEGASRELHLVAKAALQSWASWGNVWFGLFIFFRESFWFSTALGELGKLTNKEQAAALLEVVPKVHLSYCNYQKEDLVSCFIRRPKEKGVIVMENLKEGGEDRFVDLKEIERTSGGGVKTAHMQMLLKGLAHFHGAWNLWLRKGEGLGHLSKNQVMDFFKQQSAYQYKWMWKMIIKRMLNYYSLLAEAKNEQDTKERVDAFRNSPDSAEKFMKTFDYKDSKFQTVCHSDLHSAQIMFSLNDDGTPKRMKILDYQGLTLGHPSMDIWTIIYSATDAEYRATHLENDLQAYYDVFSTYMDTPVDYAEFRQEVEEGRVYGMVMFGTFCFMTLSPTKLPSPTKELSKYSAACKEMLLAEDTPEDHPDVREIRRRIAGNLKEIGDLGWI